MIDRLILAPYFITLKIRHLLFDCGVFKSHRAEVPTICVGNITVGGTGKTPHTEMIIRLLRDSGLNLAVLARGYKRKSKGFQQVVSKDSYEEFISAESDVKSHILPRRLRGKTQAQMFGDEPSQIKNKFPEITVAVDADRVEGCDILRHPEKLASSKKPGKCIFKDFPAADLIVLDDAYQHRSLSPSLSILIIDYNRPIHKDMLLPLGHLRDLTERHNAADVIIISKCPAYMSDTDKAQWVRMLGISNFSFETFQGVNEKGKKQTVLFTKIDYAEPEAVFPDGDAHYIYAKRAIVVTGIANDKPFRRHLSGNYKVVTHLGFGDHHSFTSSDISAVARAVEVNPTAIIMTTEKDSQRLSGMKNIPEEVRKRLFRVPIAAAFLSEEESAAFKAILGELR